MEIGIDSFAAAYDDTSLQQSQSDRLRNLVDEIQYADRAGLDSFGIGEHHRKEYLDSAPPVLLGAAAARTDRIRLTSALTGLGVGGSPGSFVRAGELGLPLMVAIIGGETRRFRPLVDLYREAGRRAGFTPDQLKVGVHALGYVAPTSEQAADDFFPGYARAFS